MNFISVTPVNNHNLLKRFVRAEDIVIVDVNENYLTLHLTEGSAIQIRETEEQIFQLMKDCLGNESVYVHQGTKSNNQ